MSLGDAAASPTTIPVTDDDDIPSFMTVNAKLGIIFVLTSRGNLCIFDIHTGTVLFRTQPPYQHRIIATAVHTHANGIMCVTHTRGTVFTLSVNERTLVPFVRDKLKQTGVASAIDMRQRGTTNEKFLLSHFRDLLAKGDIRGAAAMATSSPGGTLHTPDIIQILREMDFVADEPAPMLQFFSVILETGRLNVSESAEFARCVVEENNSQFWLKRMEKFIEEKKLEPSEELGDLVAQLDLTLALGVYRDACCHRKVFRTLGDMGLPDKAQQYLAQVDCDPTSSE